MDLKRDTKDVTVSQSKDNSSNNLKKTIKNIFGDTNTKKPNYQLDNVPLKTHRYLVLFLYCIYTFLCGCVYMGWDGFSKLLYKSGAYESNCDLLDPDSNYINIGGNRFIDCPQRKIAISSLYTTALVSNFVFSFFSGLILDQIGPKITSICGLSLASLGWILLCLSGPNFSAYIPAFFFIGIASDLSYFPILSVANLFPGSQSLSLSLLGSFRSVSFAVPVILDAVFNPRIFDRLDFWKFCIGYIIIGLGISYFICIFFIPLKKYKIPICIDDSVTINSQTETETDQISNIGDNGNKKKESSIISNLREFLSLVIQPKFYVLVIFFSLIVIRSEFYTKSHLDQLAVSSGQNVYSWFTVLNIASFIPGPLFGYLCDVKGILFVFFILNTAGFFMYVFLIPNIIITKFFSLIFFFFYVSFVVSNLYCYIESTFDPQHFGKLAGLASFFAGLWTLSSIGLHSFSVTTLGYLSPYNYAPVDCLFLIFGLIGYLLIYILHKVRKRPTVVPVSTVV